MVDGLISKRDVDVSPTEMELRPALRSVLIAAWGWLVFLAAVGIVGVWLVVSGLSPILGQLVAIAVVVAALIVLSVKAVILRSHAYLLNQHRMSAISGVVKILRVDAPLNRIVNVLVRRSFLERVLGLGTVGAFTAADGGQVVWQWIDEPEAAAERVRRAVSGVDQTAAEPIKVTMTKHQPSSPNSTPSPRSLPVLGIAGGIGAGKSTVARAFERLGCHVIDSDVRAKAALELPNVRDALVEWWGTDILTSDHRIDRAKVASIIFTNPDERARLEALVHPIVRGDRARMIQEAAAAGAAGVIVDAPLLFEAGVYKECDAVVFVDTPREERLRRVMEARRWDEAEFARREASQMPLEEKRGRCRFTIDNGPGAEELDLQARRILRELAPDRASDRG